MPDQEIQDGARLSTGSALTLFEVSLAGGGTRKIAFNLAGTAAPGVSDDDTAGGHGYSVGSLWFDFTGNKVYWCDSAATGAAVWRELGAAATVFADNVFRIEDNGDPTKELAFEVSAIATGTTRTITVQDENADLQHLRQASTTQRGTSEAATLAETNTGTDQARFVSPYTLQNISQRPPIALTSSGVGTYTISDAAILSATGLWIRGDLLIDQQDAAADSMAYTVATAEANSVCVVVVRNGQDATFTAGGGMTLVYADAADGSATSQYISAGVGTSDRVGLLLWVTATRVLFIGGDP